MSKKTLRLIIILVSILLIFLIISLAVQIIVIPKVKHETTKALIEQYIESDPAASDLINQMSEEDISTIEKIIDNSISSSDLVTLSRYAANRDVNKIKEYADSNISESDKQKLMDLYDKYKNSVPE